jgi:glyoxylase-like metal-dependent hydrolase (beta-lactamase superfamily II)
MTYTGDVQPDGPADVRELTRATIRKLAVSSMANNVYLVTCRATGAQLLIDAADDAKRCLELVAEGAGGPGHQPRLDLVVTTHQHWDHHRALREVVSQTGAQTAAGAEDAAGLPVAPDTLLRQGDQLRVGELDLDVLQLRGHTPGSIALAYDDPDGHTHLFTGDSLFPGGVGNTKNPGQSFESLIEDVSTRVFDRYDDETWVYPGHGADTTLGVERPHLAEWRARGW